MIEGHVGTADFASRQSGQFCLLDLFTSSTVSLANCRKNSTKVSLEVKMIRRLFRGEK